MTPAEHYAEAERLLGLAHDLRALGVPVVNLHAYAAAAQVHATLATVSPRDVDPEQVLQVLEDARRKGRIR